MGPSVLESGVGRAACAEANFSLKPGWPSAAPSLQLSFVFPAAAAFCWSTLSNWSLLDEPRSAAFPCPPPRPLHSHSAPGARPELARRSRRAGGEGRAVSFGSGLYLGRCIGGFIKSPFLKSACKSWGLTRLRKFAFANYGGSTDDLLE